MLKKITVVSNILCLGPAPIEGSEVEQKFTLNSKGQVWLTCYNYSRNIENYTVGRKVRKSIGADNAEIILRDIGTHFKEDDMKIVLDAGRFNLTLFYNDDTKQYRSGALFDGDTFLKILSDKIRETTKIANLFLFDGNEDE